MGRIRAGRLTCLDAVFLGRFEPDGEVMLAAHPRLLLTELHLLPVRDRGPFAHRWALTIRDLCGPLARYVFLIK